MHEYMYTYREASPSDILRCHPEAIWITTTEKEPSIWRKSKKNIDLAPLFSLNLWVDIEVGTLIDG